GEDGTVRRRGVWFALDNYSGSPKGNYFGPYSIGFPIHLLNGRRFAVREVPASNLAKVEYTLVESSPKGQRLGDNSLPFRSGADIFREGGQVYRRSHVA